MAWFCQRDGRTSAVRRRSLNLPAPTICAGGMGDALAGGYWIESAADMAVYYASDNINYNSARGGRRQSIDAPSLAIMAAGLGGDSLGHWALHDDGAPDMPPESDPTKPPYCVPTMPEIAAVPWNGLTVCSTFAGCGGSSLGYRMAGYRVLWASEFVPAAQDSYRANMRPGTILDPRDVKLVQPADILTATGLAVGELDVLDGSPPCQAFSTAGKRAQGWGKDRSYEHGAKQRNEDLFQEYVRLLRGLMPRAFVAENVSGLVKGVAKGYFLEILAALKDCGYRVEARVLDAQWLGVPQQRQRVIFVGVRDGLGLDPAFPDPLPYRYSVREAIPWLTQINLGAHGFQNERRLDGASPAPTIMARGLSSYKYDVEMRQGSGNGRVVHDTGRVGQSARDVTDQPCPTITAGPSDAADGGGPRNHFFVEPESDISRYAIGSEADKLHPGQTSDRFFQLQRADSEAPSPAILSSSGGASVIHPTEKRKFSIAELRRICAFPDDFALTGSYAQQWERLGNSVPPLMMRAVAETLRDRVLLPARGPSGSSKAD